MSFSIRQDGIMDPEGKYPNPLTGEPYSKQYFYHARRMDNGIVKGWSTFATFRDRIEIFKRIHKYNILLAKLPPGTGKTVMIPKILLHYFGYSKKIICTTPKQVTTSSAGEYAALCLDVPLFKVDDTGKNILKPGANVNDKSVSPYYDTGMRFVGYKYSGKNISNNILCCILMRTYYSTLQIN